MYKTTALNVIVTISLFGLLLPGSSLANECPVGVLPGSPGTPETTLDDEFGPGTSGLTNCLVNRENVRIVMQINKSCQDSYATHPLKVNGKPTGESSRVVNDVASCADTRAYALGNLRNMLKDLTITHAIPPDQIDIRVVVHSGGGFLMLKDAGYDGNGNYIDGGRNKFQSQIEDLMAQGVRFLFCQNTTRSFIRNKTLPGPDMIATTGGATAQLISGIEYTTAGVTAISDLQEQGFRYIQP